MGQCERSLKKLKLKLCSKSDGICNDEDMNGLLESCEQIESSPDDSNRRRLKKKKKEYRFCSGQDDGVIIDSDDEQFEFKLCLRNVFDDELIFSNSVYFDTRAPKNGNSKKKKKERYECTADYLQGLPCLNEQTFVSGKYDKTGFNAKYKNVNKGGKKGKNSKQKGQAMNAGEAATESGNNSIKGLLVAAVVMFALVLIGAAVYYWFRKNKRAASVRRDSMAQMVGRPSAAKHHVTAYGDTEMMEAMGRIEGNEIECSDSEVVYLSHDEV